jgi:hypothetical protein
MNRLLIVFLVAFFNLPQSSLYASDGSETNADTTDVWVVDFFDDFDTFNPDNWQDQRIWVNNETQCYVPDGKYGTREVSNGTIKMKVVNIGEEIVCDNFDKYGKQHPNTQYVAGRICSKKQKGIHQRKMDRPG